MLFAGKLKEKEAGSGTTAAIHPVSSDQRLESANGNMEGITIIIL